MVVFDIWGMGVATALGEGGARAKCVAEILKGSLHNDQNV